MKINAFNELIYARQTEEPSDYRSPFRVDVDKIIHSKAFARYTDKTQVVYLVSNDHITHRGLHVQYVSSFSRGIAKELNLNSDLVEAIALGHDVGHPPFGHEGEGYLSKLSVEYGQGHFAHPIQSCRLFSLIEPLNLTFSVLDGFLCHDGGLSTPDLVPSLGKNWQDYELDILQKKNNPDLNRLPSTLEGCLVKICDTISYTARDIEDAIRLNIIQREQIPETLLGNSNQDILTRVADDLLKNSYQKEYISLSKPIFNALKTLRTFNFKNIYFHPSIKSQSKKIQKSYQLLFEHLYKDLKQNKTDSHVWTYFASSKTEKYIHSTNPEQMIIDYIAGMTDSFFIKTFENLLVPSSIPI